MTIPDEESRADDSVNYRPSSLTILITLLVLLAMLASLVWPLLLNERRHLPTPTPTPLFWQEA